jgi:hypothetical protein
MLAAQKPALELAVVLTQTLSADSSAANFKCLSEIFNWCALVNSCASSA